MFAQLSLEPGCSWLPPPSCGAALAAHAAAQAPVQHSSLPCGAQRSTLTARSHGERAWRRSPVSNSVLGCRGSAGPARAADRARIPFCTNMQADRDPRDNEEEVPSDAEAEEPSRAAEGSDDEGEDLMDQMEA